MSTRLRIVLPSVMGILSLPLVLWDIHNERVIESIGMGWDTGAPIWPYQASDILLRLIKWSCVLRCHANCQLVETGCSDALFLGRSSHSDLVVVLGFDT